MTVCLTVDVEEWYHDLWPGTDRIISEYYKGTLPTGTFVEPLKSILQMLERQHAWATFFVLGESATACPEMVEQILDSGHEVASHGYLHKDLTKMSLDELAGTEKRNRAVFRKITGEEPKGFRAPNFKVNPKMINALERVGYEYDSSVVPSISIPGWFGYFNAPLGPYRTGKLGSSFFEFPVAVFPHLRLPAGGGWFIRNLGSRYVETAIRLLLRKGLPAIMYIHPLDVYANVPRLEGIPFHTTRRCGDYTLKAIEHILANLDCRKVPIRDLLKEYST